MCYVRYFAAVVCVSLLSYLPAAASPLVTGNGFGFAVVSPETATLNKFYAHPYSFSRPDVQNPLSEGVETANFIKSLSWIGGTAREQSAEYVEDSQVILARSSAGEGLFFMPFGLTQTALVISWEPRGAYEQQGRWHVEWSRALKSQRTVRMLGAEMLLLKFDGIRESLLLIPLVPKRVTTAHSHELLSGSVAWAMISLENDRGLERTARQFSRWRAGLMPHALAKREIAEIERWRVHPAIHFPGDKERHLWRQSEIVLRMAQSREPNHPGRNNNGLIVACLPDGSWFMPWTRDMAYAAVAFARMGHRNEARAALLAYFRRRVR